jgi:GNAT superfamily N-acetyltransferase
MMGLYAISQLIDEEQIRTYLMTNSAYAAYALGDLEPPYSQRAIWIGASQTGAIEGLALIYNGLDPTVLFLMGETRAISALLMHGVGPDRVFFSIQPAMEEVLSTFYSIEHSQPMYRMLVTPETFAPFKPVQSMPLPTPLDGNHLADMTTLIAEAATNDKRDTRDIAFSPEMVQTGYYRGIYQRGRLIALAGVHLVARRANIAAVGNVVVHPKERQQGLGSLVSHAVTQALLDEGFDPVVLNVRQDNEPAIKIYRKLGYKVGCNFVEGAASRR